MRIAGYTAGFLIAGAILLAISGAGAESAIVDHASEYEACMKLARERPEEAMESALAWEDKGGGTAAEHCQAVAMLNQGHHAAGARRLEELAEHLGPERQHLKTSILAQAGQAWLLADKVERAYAVQTAALKLSPDDASLLVDRGATLAEARNYWEAIDDLNRAAMLRPDDPDILVFRASAYRFVDAFELAMEDVDRALELDPDHPEGLLERGILRRLQGNDPGARQDWLKLVTTWPGSEAAAAARRNLERLDVEVEK